MARGKAKFKVGQVVADKDSGCYYKVRIIRRFEGQWKYDLGTLMTWFEDELRPLTKRERGGK